MNHNQKIGKFGEQVAVEYLKKKGYEIMDLNYRYSNQEIDVIAKIKEKIVFFEVKTRTSAKMGLAEDNLNRKKIKNLKIALKAYLAYKNLDPEQAQIDFLAIDLDKLKNSAKIKHYFDII
ncbi:MAG: YraN family protein [Planctomycetes bacterium]|jgi:putative endonuclease|nr:YraN family protein [Planctomycetota bacterium]